MGSANHAHSSAQRQLQSRRRRSGMQDILIVYREAKVRISKSTISRGSLSFQNQSISKGKMRFSVNHLPFSEWRVAEVHSSTNSSTDPPDFDTFDIEFRIRNPLLC